MHTYVKLKSDKVMVLWSDNHEEETMDLYELSELEDFDPDFLQLTTINYSEIDWIDTNLAALRRINEKTNR